MLTGSSTVRPALSVQALVALRRSKYSIGKVDQESFRLRVAFCKSSPRNHRPENSLLAGPDQEAVWLQAVGPFRDPSGPSIGVITERRGVSRSPGALAKREERLLDIFERNGAASERLAVTTRTSARCSGARDDGTPGIATSPPIDPPSVARMKLLLIPWTPFSSTCATEGSTSSGWRPRSPPR
jgi:hypothetical protein